MGLIPANTLARLRAYHAARLPDTAQVYRNDPATRDAEGGYSAAPAPGATYAARVMGETSPPVELVATGRPTGEMPWTIELPWNADVRPTDRLKVGTTFYDVTDADNDESERVLLTVRCWRVR